MHADLCYSRQGVTRASDIYSTLGRFCGRKSYTEDSKLISILRLLIDARIKIS